MSVFSIDTKSAPARRRADTSLTAADATMIAAWAVLTVVLLGYATVEGSVGALLLAAVTMQQSWNAWKGAERRDESALLRFD
jgi:hypothetical protein